MKIIAKARAQTDPHVVLRAGKLLCVVEDPSPSEGIWGYYRTARKNEYIYQPYSGYSFWLDEDGEVRSAYGTPDGMQECDPNDGSQEIIYFRDDLCHTLRRLLQGGV